MTSVILTPMEFTSTEQLSRQLFRKRVLPVDSIDYDGRKIDFTSAYMNTIVTAFNDGAFDNVPLQFADKNNSHTNEPEQYRGDVVGMSVEDDGLYVTVAATARGAKVLEENPKLGISARIINDYDRSDGKHYTAAVQHVLATHDPRITGLGPWSKVENYSNDNSAAILDLTGIEFPSKKKKTKKEKSVPDKDKLSNDELAQLRALLNELNSEEASDDAPENVDDELTPEELEALIAVLDADDEEAEPAAVEAEAEPELVEASNDTANKALELANEQATELSRVREELDTTKWENEREILMRKNGIPPKIVDLAAPLLKGSGHVLEFANGEKVDAGDIMRNVFTEVGKLVKILDLGNELGNSEGFEPDTSAEAAAKRDETTKAVKAMMGN